MNDIFVKLPHLNLTEQQQNELFNIQESLDYTEFIALDKTHDGNYLAKDPNLPNWINEKFRNILKHSKHIIFLKNKGTIIHVDLNRKCSLTIPLSNSNIPTNFYLDEYVIAKLYHDGNTYLQNNEVTHSVDWGEEWRYFLQISFKHTYKKIYRTLWQKK
ncbi:MAG: hypothetical protein CXT73_00130 [Methanobacteriota archaeon]|jgi:hypothetical protein|nr:MAG: hypothetical protein CXT73_00130 [Euryarchaeota archaeon]